jgi:Cytochrome P450
MLPPWRRRADAPGRPVLRLAGRIAGTLAAGLTISTLPRWLPPRVVALRMWIFARINGNEAIAVPGPLVDVTRFRDVYSHPAANGRSRGAALSDLFWYWLSPGPEVHQEHLEPGERYEEVARTTRHILSIGTARVDELATRYTSSACDEIRGMRVVRVRDLMMPIWAGVFAEIVFGQACPRKARDLIVANADDVVTALKCCGLRHMDRRHRLTRYLVDRLDQVPHPLPAGLSPHERALYLQGTFFNTAVVQMSEAMAHLLMVLAHRPELQAELAAHPDDRRRFDRVMNETMRMYPLFGIAHRIASDDIALDGTTLPAGSVLCFNYPEFHRAGFDHSDRFDPGRWDHLSSREANYIPFGVAGNRPCPAWHVAPIALRAATREILRRFFLRSSAGHTRSIPNRGPCILVPRHVQPRRLGAALTRMHLQDRAEDVSRSLTQLVLGSYMVWDARRQRLCERHVDGTLEPTAGR